MSGTINYYYKGLVYTINCKLNNKMDYIFKSIAKRLDININNVSFLLNEEKVNSEKTISELFLQFSPNIELIVREMNIIQNNSEKSEKNVKQKDDTIEINYKINKNSNFIKIFGVDFVENNKEKCKILYKNKEYDLQSVFNIQNIEEKDNNILNIKLKGINNITDLSCMFYKCSELLSLPDISKINTSKVIDMHSLFSHCTSLISIDDISKWDTSNVIDMSWLFKSCISLESLPDLSKWKTNNVKYMIEIFRDCKSLLRLPDISKWNISNVIDIGAIFLGCKKLSYLPDISKWDTSNLVNMNSMFSECSSLIILPDITKWDTSKVINISNLFSFCSSLVFP